MTTETNRENKKKRSHNSTVRGRITTFLTSVKSIMDWLGNVDSINSTHMIKNLISSLQRVYVTRGSKGLLDFVKSTRTALQQYLSGTPVSVKGISLTKDGIPKVLGDLIPIIRNVHHAQHASAARSVFTVLFSTRSLYLGKVPDLTPITSPGRSKLDLYAAFGHHLNGFWSWLNGKHPNIKSTRVLWKRYHMTSKSGPNGQALWTCLSDLFCLPGSLLASIKVIGGKDISDKIDTLLQLKSQLSLVLPTQGKSYRKITSFPDKEYKVRVIAILDYWSQTVLKPLHHWLFTCLRSIPQDCTFDQGSFWEKIKESKVFYSIDLTAATDRFPIDFISLVLEPKFGAHFVNHWKNIMVGYPFEFQGNMVTYSVGNPMGAYSSWSSFALAHHFLVYTCIRDVGLQWDQVPYCLLGDDIVIGHKDVAELYLSRINDLGVDVSPLKTHKSSHFLEFAKRMIYRNVEITPFPISGLREVERSAILLNSFLTETSSKGWCYPQGSPSFGDLYYSIVKKLPSRLRKKYLNNAILGDHMIKVIRGLLPAYEAFSSLIRQLDLQTEVPSPEECESILLTCALRLFLRGLPRGDETKGYPLGKLAEDLVIYLTTEDRIDTISSLKLEAIYALPQLGCYGQIEEEFTNFHKRLRSGIAWSGDHSDLFKVLALPLDDRVFVRRHSHLILNASHALGKEILIELAKYQPIKIKFSEHG